MSLIDGPDKNGNFVKGTTLIGYSVEIIKITLILNYTQQTAFYFTITTMTTVGYGDISGTNTLERYLNIIIMILGVIFFTISL